MIKTVTALVMSKENEVRSANAPFPSCRSPAVLLATWFGSGLLPKAPGTWGSLAALPFAWGIQTLAGNAGLLAATVMVFIVGIWASNETIRLAEMNDPGEIVIDEVAGIWLVLAVVPMDISLYAIGFVLFRFFDIIKPWPVSWADRQIKGGLGVMVDDILAGVYGAVILYFIHTYFGLGST